MSSDLKRALADLVAITKVVENEGGSILDDRVQAAVAKVTAALPMTTEEAAEQLRQRRTEAEAS